MSRNAICEIYFKRRRAKSCKSRICGAVSSNLSSFSLRYSERRSVLRVKKKSLLRLYRAYEGEGGRGGEASRVNVNSVYAKIGEAKLDEPKSDFSSRGRKRQVEADLQRDNHIAV